jgi:hypothetical protein
MHSGRLLSVLLLVATSLPCVAETHPRRGPTSHRFFNKKSTTTTTKSKKTSGQRSIDDDRATQIQTALVHSGYMSDSAASGHWDSQTEAAMQKFQADNGWQTKLMPDSRAIIKLGLGPSHDSQAGSSGTPTSSLGTASSFTASAAH